MRSGLRCPKSNAASQTMQSIRLAQLVSVRLTRFTVIVYLVLKPRPQRRFNSSEFLVVEATPLLHFAEIRQVIAGRFVVFDATAKPSHDIPRYNRHNQQQR